MDTQKISDIDLTAEHTPQYAPSSVDWLKFNSVCGETSSAIVWNATQISLDRPVTVWVMRPENAGDKKKAEHFVAVARAAARIRHPNLAQVINVSHDANGVPYTVFEHTGGQGLNAVLRREGRFETKRALEFILEIASALDAAWKQIGFIHRNIKPENIVVTEDGAVKIVNFGSATLVKPGENPLEFDDDNMVGTPNYASPEQIGCRRTIDFRSDIYGAGALLYHMITGIAPFAGENDPMAVLTMQLNDTLPSPCDMEPPVDLSVSRLMQRMMAKSPADRYGFWQDVIEDIQRINSGRPLFAETSGDYTAPRSTIADPADLAGLLAAGKLRAKRPAGYIVAQTPKPVSPVAAIIAAKQAAAAAAKATDNNSSPGVLKAADGKKKNAAAIAPPSKSAILLGTLVVVATMFLTTCARVSNLERADADAGGRLSPAAADDTPQDPQIPTPDTRHPTPESRDPVPTSHNPNRPNREQRQAERNTPSTPSTASTTSTPSTPQPVNRAANYTQLLAAITGHLRNPDRPFDNSQTGAKNAISVLMTSYKDRLTPNDTETCKKIWSCVSDAAPYTELVSRAIYDTTPGQTTRQIRIGGETLMLRPTGLGGPAGGQLFATTYNPNGSIRAERQIVDMSRMTRDEMHEITSSYNVDAAKRPLALSKTFLSISLGKRAEALSLIEKYDLPELRGLVGN